jgi:anti-sigma regulatory factor (Ser/Thr protein kinase)
VIHRNLITLRNDLAELRRLAEALEEFGKSHGLSTAVVHKINLILEELVTNTVLYGYEDEDEHHIVIRVATDGDDVHLEVEDDGRPFDPLQVPPPDITRPVEARPVGGLGIYLVRHLAENIAYRRERGRNVVTIRTKTLPDA